MSIVVVIAVLLLWCSEVAHNNKKLEEAIKISTSTKENV